MKLITFVSLLTMSFSSAVLAAEQTAIDWLQQLSQAISNKNFSTSFVVVKNNHAEPYHWYHGVDDNGKQFEILALLNGPRRDVLRQDKLVSYFEPEFNPYSVHADHIQGPIPAIFSGDVSQLLSQYDVIAAGKSRVLGRPAQIIRIIAKDHQRLAHRLWLDLDSGLLLKMAVLTRQGKVLEQIQFTYLDISDKPSNAIKTLMNAKLPNAITLPEKTTQPMAWQVDWLPEGFTEINRDRHKLAMVDQAVDFRLFSDGLVNFSVYVSPSKHKYRNLEIVKDGATLILNKVSGYKEVSIVGKIPVATAKSIANSVSFSLVNSQP